MNKYNNFIKIGYIYSKYKNFFYKIISFTEPLNNLFKYNTFIKINNYFFNIKINNIFLYKKNIFITKIYSIEKNILKKNIYIKENILPKIENYIYWKDIIKCKIILNNNYYGIIKNIFRTKYYDVMIVLFRQNLKNNEIFIPIIDKFINYFDIKNNNIYIKNYFLLKIK